MRLDCSSATIFKLGRWGLRDPTLGAFWHFKEVLQALYQMQKESNEKLRPFAQDLQYKNRFLPQNSGKYHLQKMEIF